MNLGLDPWQWGAAATCGIVAALLDRLWTVSRHAITLIHEAGHAGVAISTGRRLRSIRLHRDSSGLTTSVGRPRGPGMVLTALAGYPMPPLVGLLLVWLVVTARPSWAVIGLAMTVGAVALLVRSWFGLVVVITVGAATLGIWHTPAPTQSLVMLGLGWLLLFGGLRASVELWSARRHSRSRTSDADVLAGLSHLPAAVWNLVFIAIALGCLAIGIDLTVGVAG